ncbi:hypothetical protein SAMD00019534_042440 [Acytostelium subglobosum LB1]|uniref:hypothetical protein n=1 Tax=Acytostelium subglobosum LB1 TaxID=1410327 RepID=UPI000644FCB9|nr:hypothetical protein SAMD00019534_042440 [Acytostelium subglobosum LB1]GAM21069.1 hypothetical protein SAMD00019534_042440 [Acytostelium subglobosum LB1]|eukprot:XP_012756203.1 hypothetical protein SAMD00019534_042440 [Acytostelium subglobosum LB1]
MVGTKRLADALTRVDRDDEVTNKKSKKKVIKLSTLAPKTTQQQQLQQQQQQQQQQTKNNNKSNINNDDNIQLLKSILDTYMTAVNVNVNNANNNNIDIQQIVSLLHHNQCLQMVLADRAQTKFTTQWCAAVLAMLRPSSPQLPLGLRLMAETIRVCDYDTMVANADKWSKVLVSIVPTGKVNEVALQPADYSSLVATLALLVEKSALWNDLKRSIVTNTTLAPIVSAVCSSLQPDSTIQYGLQAQVDSLIALNTLVLSLSSAIRPHLNKIETLVYPLLVSRELSLQESASTVIANLPSTVNLLASDLYWDVTVQRLVVEMHAHASAIYIGIEDDETSKTDFPLAVVMPSSSKLNSSGEDAIMNQLSHVANITINTPSTLVDCQSRANSFHGLAKCLVRLMTTQTQSACSVPVDVIIKLLCRVLNIGFYNIRSRKDHSDIPLCQLLSVTVQLHQQCLAILSSMLQSFRRALLPYAKTISSLLLRPLRMRETYSNATIQLQVYSTIRVAIESLGAACADSLATPSVAFLLRDVQPFVPQEISITAATAVSGKKKNKQTTAPMAQQSVDEPTNNTIGNVDANHLHDTSSLDIKVAAGKALQSLLLHCGSQLATSRATGASLQASSGPQAMRTEIDQQLLSLILQCHSLVASKKNTATYIGSSFASWQYRQVLYACLISAVLRPIPSVPAVLPYALRLLTVGCNTDDHPKVRSECSKGAAVCQALIHPQCPSLQSPASTINGGAAAQTSASKSSLSRANDDMMDIINSYENDEEQEETDEDNQHDDDEDANDKIDITFNDMSDDDEEEDEEDAGALGQDDDEEEEDEESVGKTTKTSTTTTTTTTTGGPIMRSMRTNLFDDSAFGTTPSSITSKQSTSSTSTTSVSSNAKPSNNANIKMDTTNDDDDEDDDLPDLIVGSSDDE